MGIDIGGTFTDFTLLDYATGRMTVEKVPSTPPDFWSGIASGIEKLDLPLAEVQMIVHGTTVGLNALLERRGGRVGLITTAGFRDVYEIARHNRTETYDLYYRKPVPLIPRRYRLEVRERIDQEGNIIVALNEEDVLDCIQHFKDAEITSIAVCLLHSYANPAHERRVADLLAREYPDAAVSISHALARQWREYERTSTTAINSYIMSTVGDYLEKVDSSLGPIGYGHPLFINESAGGIMSVRLAKARPVHTIMSGPAGGAVAAVHVAGLAGHANVIGFDMGGTSTDVTLVHESSLRVTTESEVDRYPLMVPMIDVKSIGAGGGSIAWLDVAGALNVGPKSAGADPGPVCYGKGGLEPTVTDANLLLGRLHPGYFLGGEIQLEQNPARTQLETRIAQPLQLDIMEAAAGIIEVINTKMAYAIRAITIERGLDPKDFVLLAFGGAGPMHACALARTLGIPEVIVPVAPGAFSAMGMLVSDIRHDFVRTFPTAMVDGVPSDAINQKFHEMIAEGRAVLEQEGSVMELMDFQCSVDMRYVGQEYTIRVPMPGAELDQASAAGLRTAFHELHERTYSHSSSTEGTEIVNLRVVAVGRVAKPKFEAATTASENLDTRARAGSVSMHFADGSLDAPIFQRQYLATGNRIHGPALVVEKSATTVVEPGYLVDVTPHGHLSIKREA
jgi:N-methylhydantoinase A